MFSSNYIGLFLTFTALSACLSCNLPDAKNPDTQNESTIGTTRNSAPFSTTEPETFQAEIIVRSFNGGVASEKRYFFAKKADKSLMAFDYTAENETALLETEDRQLVISRKNKTYREKFRTAPSTETNGLRKFLTTKWLNEKKESKFERAGTKNGLVEYRVTIEDSAKSEIFVYVDEKTGLPVKQEIFSVSGNEKKLTFSVELKDISLEVDESTFTLPEGYKPEAKPNDQ